MKKTSICLLSVCCIFLGSAKKGQSQDANGLLTRIKARLQQVDNYTAEGRMVTDVKFINIAAANVKVYFRQPDQFRIVKEGGISILPKGGLSVGLNALLSGKDFIAVPGGYTQAGKEKLAIIKLIPVVDNSDLVLTTLLVDEKTALVFRTTTTTRDNGTYETNLEYGKYASFGLPDKVLFVFNIAAYKLPKGVTMEYEGSKKATAAKPAGDGKGRVSITYSGYTINKGVPAELFK